MNQPPHTALVTGGTAGIGKRIAEALQDEGYRVAVMGRRPDRVNAMIDRGMLGYAIDVADSDGVATLANDLERQFGQLDALINVAGTVQRAPLESQSVATIGETLASNLNGTILVTRAMTSLLRKARGSIVNFSSGLAHRPMAGTAVYTAAKAGIEAFTRAIALELGPAKIRVNCIAPSLVRSEIWISAGMDPVAYEQMLADRGAEYPLGRVGEPQDIANIVSFLVSPRAEWITGAVIPVDGGSTIGLVKPP